MRPMEPTVLSNTIPTENQVSMLLLNALATPTIPITTDMVTVGMADMDTVPPLVMPIKINTKKDLNGLITNEEKNRLYHENTQIFYSNDDHS